MIPFASDAAGLISATTFDGKPAQIGAVGFGEAFMADLSDGLDGAITISGFGQYGITIPVHCVLDTICLSVGNPALHCAPGQMIHTFATIATANGNSQLFTLHPVAKAEVEFAQDTSYPTQITTARVTGLKLVLAPETRYIVVCGHYTTGSPGETRYLFTYSGSLLFR